LKAAHLVTGGVNSLGGNKVKKLLAGLGALGFLVGSGLALAQEVDTQGPCSPARVSVAYVDNDTPDGHTGSFFPTPFAPLPANPGGTCTAANNCIFIGAPGPDGDWDGGVIKIDNPLPAGDPSSTPLVVQGVTVDIPTAVTINPWAAFFPITIPPGGTLILTQVGNMFDFDTSDTPASAGPPECNHNNFKPLIHVTVGTGASQIIRNFSDDNQVLNTGGVDKGLCPVGTHTNEGQQYRRAIEQQITCVLALPTPL
jgi:hypothetical protein